MHRSAVKLPGAFFSDYWTQMLWQAVASEPSIRHAVLAVGSAHREEVQGTKALIPGSNEEHALFTVRQYSKAINALQPCLCDNRRTSVRITLVACALFIYLEFLRGHYTQGIIHLEHGLSLLRGSGGCNDSINSTTNGSDGWLVTFLIRPLIQAKLLGQILRVQCHAFLEQNLQPKLENFRSTHHARGCLEQIMLRIFDLQDHLQQSLQPLAAEPGADFIDHQNLIQNDLQIWLETHQATVRSLPKTHSALESFAYRLLRIYYLVAVILAGTCLETSSQLASDRYDSQFLAIISNSIDIYDIRRVAEIQSTTGHLDPESSSPNSVSDLGWIAPLYFAATKCRNHRIRHQAIRLLQLKPHKEGIWSSTLAVVTAKQVVEIEEGNFYRNIGKDDFDELTAPTVEDLAAATLPDERRLRTLNIMLPDDRAGKLLLRTSRKEQSGMITCISKEYDLLSQLWGNVPGTSGNTLNAGHCLEGPRLYPQALFFRRTSDPSTPHWSAKASQQPPCLSHT